MKLPQLHSLLPSRGMMFVALGLTLAIGWYFYNASGVADHLTKRNFNFLNQISSNIDASVDAANQIGRFSEVRIVTEIYRSYNKDFVQKNKEYGDLDDDEKKAPVSPLPPSPEKVLKRSIISVLEEEKSRLVRDGHLASDSKNISIEVSVEKDLDAQTFSEPLWRVLPVETFQITDSEQKSFACLTSTRPKFSPVELTSSGFTSTFSMWLGVPDLDWDECKYNGKHPEKKLRARFSLTIPFTEIQGVGNGETFFDTILLAKSGGSPDDSPVLLSNADEQLYSGSLFRLLNASSRFERFTSIGAFENSNMEMHTDSAIGDAERDTASKPLAFTQSTVVPLEIGGFSKLAFVQPLNSAHFPEGDYVLIGIAAESSFNKLRYAVPYNWLSNALLLLLLGVLSMNFARLKLIKNKGLLRRWDVSVGIFSLAGVASLFVVFLMQVLASWEFDALSDRDLKKIHTEITEQFSNELNAKMLQVESIHSESISASKMARCLTDNGEDNENNKNNKNNKDSINWEIKCGTKGFPEIASQFLLNEEGAQHRYYYTHNKTANLGFKVPDRAYFTKIRAGEGWKTIKSTWGEELQLVKESVFQGEFLLERIESKSNGAQQTALSMPVGDDVLVALTRFYSLEHTVLPPGFGFAVFDNETGLVLFHSTESRNLRENFYRATDDDEELKSAVLSRSEKKISLPYKGELVEAKVSPLKHTRWSLVTFYRSSIAEAFNFHLGTSALILAGTYMAIFLVALPGIILLFRWLWRMTVSIRLEEKKGQTRLPQWFFPERGKISAQQSLGTTLLQLLLAYIACIYFFDLPDVRWWILLVVIAVPCCWFYFLHAKPDADAKAPVGTSLGSLDSSRGGGAVHSRVTRAYAYYRLNLTLSILLLSVLPTLLLINENYDVHQKQWMEFSHWFEVEKFKNRSALYREMNAKLLKQTPEDFEVPSGTRAWRGVYIPGADFGDRLPKLGATSDSVDKSQSFFDAITMPWLLDQTRTIEVKGVSSPEGENCKKSGVRGGYLNSMLSILPSLGVERAVLEGLDLGRNRYFSCGGELVIALNDPVSGLSYISRSDFPQTRPRDLQGIAYWVLFHLFVLAISAIVAASIAGFLVRKFLSRSFEEGLLDMTTIPIARDLVSGAIVVRPSDVEAQEAYQMVLHILELDEKDLEEIRGEAAPVDQLVVTEKSGKIMIVKDFYSVIQNGAVSSEILALVRSRLLDGYSLIVLSDIDPNLWVKGDQFTEEASELWEGVISSLSTFMLPISGEGRNLHDRRYALRSRVYRRVWSRCSDDERMVLAGLCHEGIVNPRNELTLRSLYRRRLVYFENSHFEFGDLTWREYVEEKLSREDFRERARRYQNNVWISFRGPMILILLVLVMFIAYVAQDEMRLLFSLIASIGAGAGALSALGGRLKAMTTNVDDS